MSSVKQEIRQNDATLFYSPALNAIESLKLPLVPSKLSQLKIIEIRSASSPFFSSSSQFSCLNKDSCTDKKTSYDHAFCSLNNVCLPTQQSNLFRCSRKSIRLLNQVNDSDKQYIIEMCLLLQSHDSFQAGDSIGLLQSNNEKQVRFVISRFATPLPIGRIYFEGVKSALISHLPQNEVDARDVFELLSNCIELRALPSKAMVRVLGDFCSNPAQKRRLHELSSREGAVEFEKFIIKPHLTLCDLLRAFSTCQPSLNAIIACLPALRPRYYSMVRVRSIDDELLEFTCTFSVQRHGEGIDRPEYERMGLVTGSAFQALNENCLNDLSESFNDLLVSCNTKQTMWAFKRKNMLFYLPFNTCERPILMISAGTGLAAFISFLEQLAVMRKGKIRGKVCLLHGCRTKQSLIYKQELEIFYKQLKVLNQFHICYSRESEQKPDAPKHVQEVIQANSLELTDFLQDPSCLVYICGPNKQMVNGTKETLQSICSSDVINLMKKENRLLEDNWA